MSFVAGKRLTAGRLAAVMLAALLLTLVVAVLTPLVGVEDGGGGRRLTWLPLGAILDDDLTRQIYVHARLPRTLAALIVGAGLAAAGCALQAVLRNPLAEPFTLGISSGAALAAVIAIRLGLTATVFGIDPIGAAALLGSLVTVLAVWRLARIGDDLPPATLLLAGITIAMCCSAGSLLVQYTASLAEVNHMVRWMMGGLEWTRYEPLVRAGIPIGMGLVVLLACARDFNAMAAGSEAAASVGVDAGRTTAIAFVTSSLIVGAAIALAGPIGFVGLIVPHGLRAVVGPDHRALLPASMLVGGALVAICDTVARLVLYPAYLPVGVITALLGGAFFLFILMREKTRGRIWGG